MITLAEIKSYLKITNTDSDTVLATYINSAISKIDSICNRTFVSGTYTEILNGNGTVTMYLKGYPVTAVTSIKYWDTVSEDYVTIFDTGDTVANSVLISNDKITLRQGYTFFSGGEFQIIYTSGYTTQSVTTLDKIYTGLINSDGLHHTTLTAQENTLGAIVWAYSDFHNDTGTITLTGAFPDDKVFAPEVAFIDANFHPKTLKFVRTSDDVLTFTIYDSTGTMAIDTAITDLPFEIRVYASASADTTSTAPNDLKQICTEMAVIMYQDSAQGKGRLGIASENIGAQASQSYTFKEMDWNKILEKYKRPVL